MKNVGMMPSDCCGAEIAHQVAGKSRRDRITITCIFEEVFSKFEYCRCFPVNAITRVYVHCYLVKNLVQFQKSG